MTSPAATVVLMTASHTEASRWPYRDQHRANEAATAISSGLRYGLAKVPLLPDEPDMPLCYLDAKGLSYVRVIYHVPTPAAVIARPLLEYDYQARASGERED